MIITLRLRFTSLTNLTQAGPLSSSLQHPRVLNYTQGVHCIISFEQSELVVSESLEIMDLRISNRTGVFSTNARKFIISDFTGLNRGLRPRRSRIWRQKKTQITIDALLVDFPYFETFSSMLQVSPSHFYIISETVWAFFRQKIGFLKMTKDPIFAT